MTRGMAWVLMSLLVCAFAVWLSGNFWPINASQFVLRTLGAFAILWAIAGGYRSLRG